MKFVLIVATIFLSGCAVAIKMPTSRLDSPETMGSAKRFKLEAAREATSETFLTTNLGLNAPDTFNPRMESASRLRVGVGAGVTDWLDLEFRLPSRLHAKAQVLGNPRSSAEAGNFSLAFTGGIAAMYEKDDNSNTILSGSGRVSLKELMLDTAAIAGIRFSKAIMMYGGPFIVVDRFKGDYALNSTSGNFSGVSKVKGANLGLELGNPTIQFKVEYSYALTTLGFSRFSNNYWGMGFTGLF
jgi:hypothetical protein